MRTPSCILLAATLAAGPAAAQTLPAIDLAGDLRLRIEDDWNSHTIAGALRPERGRLRIRARVTAAADLGDGFRLQARVRTATPQSQQNANVTFADFNHNPVDDLRITPDRYSLSWRNKSLAVEGGRMAFPYFTTNEFFWDADVSPLGAAATVSTALPGAYKLRLTGGAFTLPSGLAGYSGYLYAGQAVVEQGPATAAVGLFRFEADRTDPDRLLQLNNNGSRDYTVLALNTQYKLRLAGKPLAVTADLYRNLVDYGRDADAISRAAAHQRTGVVLGVAWGDIAAARHLQLGYRYARMEKFATNASYAHDDFSRLGSATQSANTDIRGHDLYANYALTKRWTVGGRAMFTHRITNAEDDDRARVDIGYSF